MRDFPRLTHAEARERAERAARILAADERVRLVFLFGSAADPERASVRDVDLAVLTDPMDFEDLVRLRADAVGAGGGDIDLVWLNEAPPVLAWEVAETGLCLHSSPPETRVDFICRARREYFDFKYFLDRQWQLMRERQRERQHGLA